MERRSSYKIKLESFKLPRSVFSSLEISIVLMEFFDGIFQCLILKIFLFNGIFSLSCLVSMNSTKSFWNVS